MTKTKTIAAFLLSLCAATSVEAQLQPLRPSSSLELSEAKVQSCLTLCGKTLAHCERSRVRSLHCTRDSQECKEDCTALERNKQLSEKERRALICAQRCENSGALCEQSDQKNAEQCSRGTAACLKRCD